MILAFVIFGAQGGFSPNMPDTTRHIYIGVMASLAVVAFLASARRTRPEKAAIIMARAKERETYLPRLREGIAGYLNRMEYIAQDKRLYDLAEYKSRNLSLKSGLIWYDNHMYKQIQEEDEKLQEVTQFVDSLSTNVRDKKVRNFVLGMPRACHHAYSYVIFAGLTRVEYKETPFVIRVYYWLGRRMQESFRRHQSKVNERIQELLEGEADD